MSAKNVVLLKSAREIQKAEQDDHAYRFKIENLEKLDLLEEMVQFQEERSKVGHLTPKMMVRGKILFRALEDHAETQALRVLTRSYRRHLEYELNSYLETGKPNKD